MKDNRSFLIFAILTLFTVYTWLWWVKRKFREEQKRNLENRDQKGE